MAIIVLRRASLFYDKTGEGNFLVGDSTDTITGVARDHKIFGLAGDDVMFGDAAQLTGPSARGGNDFLYGGTGSDDIIGDAVTLSVGARGGADVLVQQLGSGMMLGDAEAIVSEAIGGSDLLRGAGMLIGDALTIEGATGGDDQLDASRVTRSAENILAGDAQTMIDAKGGRDLITGSRFADYLVGDADTMSGASTGGADVINGGDGDDTVVGDTSDATATVVCGNDNLQGGGGNDSIYGDATTSAPGTAMGDDVIWGGTGNDTIWGDSGSGSDEGGADSFHFQGVFGDDVVSDFGSGDDLLVLHGFTVDDLSSEETPDGNTILTVAGGGTITVLDVDFIPSDSLVFV